jgi:hypothetical protein
MLFIALLLLPMTSCYIFWMTPGEGSSLLDDTWRRKSRFTTRRSLPLKWSSQMIKKTFLEHYFCSYREFLAERKGAASIFCLFLKNWCSEWFLPSNSKNEEIYVLDPKPS